MRPQQGLGAVQGESELGQSPATSPVGCSGHPRWEVGVCCPAGISRFARCLIKSQRGPPTSALAEGLCKRGRESHRRDPPFCLNVIPCPVNRLAAAPACATYPVQGGRGTQADDFLSQSPSVLLSPSVLVQCPLFRDTFPDGLI